MTEKFVHLHNHSEYSLLDGMLRITGLDNKPSSFLKRVANSNSKTIAITDHGNMYGAIEFYNNAMAVGVKPILGCELYITSGHRTDKSKNFPTGHLTALVENNEGYKNLVEMLSYANIEGFYRHPRIDFELLEKYKKGIIFLSGCLKSLVAYPASTGDMNKAIEMAQKYKDILGKENFYLEIMDHNIPEEKIAAKNLIEISKKLDLNLVATNDCHYENKEDAFAHEVHMCISTNALLSDEKRMRMTTQELYYKSEEEMIKLFQEVPESIKNTLEIANRCFIKIEKGKLHLPDFDVPQIYMDKSINNKVEAQFLYLKDLCEKNIENKIKEFDKRYQERLNFELNVIKKMGFQSYFLIVRDFIYHSRKNFIPVGPGRGSGAGSLVAFLLDITRVDPIKHDLLFERFLNPDRKSMPDLDIDFSDTGREKVIEYVKEKYGKDNVAHIVTYGSIMAKTAIKDVGRVMGFSPTQMNNLTKLIPSNMDLKTVFQEVGEIKKLLKEENYKKLFDVALKLEGLKRHTGIHAAGILITAEPVLKNVPVSIKDNTTTTQYDGNILTELGFLKVDFLGLRTLTVIDEANKLIIERKDKNFDINKIPFDDEKTFKLLSSGKTIGIFQLESEGMQKLVKNLKPTAFSDISALVALFRPGPLQSGMVESFVKRKNGKEKIVYEHPLLEEILKDTYGNIVYQEQVMEIAKKLADFTPGEADGLRKAMGKKIMDVMEKEREHFINGCLKKDISKKIADKIFNAMVEFAKYGFNKSHSVAYATVSYQTAYLKANYPLEFMTALLTSEIGHNALNTDVENKLVKYIEEAKNLNINILNTDVNYSFEKFSIESENNIRFALTAVKNIGDSVAEELVKERIKNGLYKSPVDFMSRNNSKQFNKRVMEGLAKSGAFDSLYINESKVEIKRAKALNDISGGLEKIIDSFSQENLFLMNEEKSIKLTEHEILKNEKESIGFYFSGHPLISFKRYMLMISQNNIGDIYSKKFKEGNNIRLSGTINQIKNIRSKKNEDMCKFVFEDLVDEVEVFVSAKKYKEFKELIKVDNIITINATIKESDFASRGYELVLEDLKEIYDAMHSWAKNLIFFFDGKTIISEEIKDLKPLINLLDSNKGNCPVYFRIDSINKNSYSLETNFSVDVKKELIEKLNNIVGGKAWQIESK